jgi:hypothetical protein
MKNKSFACLVLGSIFFAAAATAQTSTIEGVLRGPDGKPMKNTDVRLESKAKGVTAKTVKTDTSGRYKFSSLGIGKYRVTVLSGSQVQGYIDNVNTSRTKAAKVDFDMKGGRAGQPKKAKHYVWVPEETGSHMGGRWVAEGDSSVETQRVGGASLRDLQNRSDNLTNIFGAFERREYNAEGREYDGGH